MSGALKKILVRFILPVVVIVILGRINAWYAVAAFIVYAALMLWFSRAFIYSILGTRNYGLGNMDKAIEWFAKAYDSKRAGIQTSTSYAYILLKNGDVKKSEEILQKLLKDNQSSPDLPKIKSNMALVLWKKGKVDEAAAMLEEVIKTYKTTSIYGSLGYLLIAAGDLDRALKLNLEAYEYNSEDKIILDNLGQNYLLLGMYDKAEEIYKPLMEKKPAFPEPYFNYGLLLEKLGNAEVALGMFKKALEYKFTYLSTISRQDVEAKIRQLGDDSEAL